MRILDRYIGFAIFSATGMVMLVLLGLESFMEFITELNNVGKGNFGIVRAVLFVVMQLPTDLYQLFPMAGFLGSLVGLGRLANNSELIVIQSATVSISRIAWAVVKVALVMLVFVTMMGEWVAPTLLQKADQMRSRAMGQAVGWKAMDGVWLRRDNHFIHVGVIKSATEIADVVRYDFSADRKLRAVSYAVKGQYVNGEWQLLDVARSLIGVTAVTVTHIKQEPLGFVFRPDLLRYQQLDVGRQSLWALLKTIQYRERAGLVSSQFEFNFWQRAIQPVTTIIMICLGIPFIFGSLREVSMGVRILTGIIVGFSFYMLNQLFGPISLVYQFPPWLAAAMPTLVFLAIYAILLRRLRRVG